MRRGSHILPILLALVIAASAARAHDEPATEIATLTERLARGTPRGADLLRRAELWRLERDWKSAARDLSLARRLDPRLAGLDLARVALDLDRGELARSRRALDGLLRARPGDAEVWRLAARADQARGELEAAARDLERWTELSPHPTPDHVLESAGAWMAAGDSARAFAAIQEGRRRLGPVPAFQRLLAGRDPGNAMAPSLASPARDVAPANLLASPAPPSIPPARSMGVASVRPGIDSGRSSISSPQIVRGPYLQLGTSTRIEIRWRTDVTAPSRVLYGLESSPLPSVAVDSTLVLEHAITLQGLAPDTRYWYAVGTLTDTLARDSVWQTFVTAPAPGTSKPIRLWVVGDSGFSGPSQNAVRDAFLLAADSRFADFWLMLGDNAYDVGTDAEYQTALFVPYRQILERMVLWPTRGNHDFVYAGDANDYYDLFTMPAAAEAGGVVSGSEAYYSFDWGDVHFVCLDSEGSDRSPGGAMLTWLAADLAATQQAWVIAFWHHPPYSKGSHDSDNDADSGGRMRDMRVNALPILEAAGVDLVLTGHSHSYERSILIDGHYGTSNTLTGTMVQDGGDGRVDGDGVYTKPSLGAAGHEGAVHAVMGCSSSLAAGALNHPVMVSGLSQLGSILVSISGARLTARFLDGSGIARDSFDIVKGVPREYPITASADSGGSISPSGLVQVHYGTSRGFSIMPGPGNAIADVTVDGVSFGALSNFTFANVQANHTIVAHFAPPGAVDAQPKGAWLGRPVPNPARGGTRIPFALPARGRARLTVLDAAGRLMARLVESVLEPGSHLAVWDGRDQQGRAAPSGVYLYRLEAGGRLLSEKLIHLR